MNCESSFEDDRRDIEKELEWFEAIPDLFLYGNDVWQFRTLLRVLKRAFLRSRNPKEIKRYMSVVKRELRYCRDSGTLLSSDYDKMMEKLYTIDTADSQEYSKVLQEIWRIVSIYLSTVKAKIAAKKELEKRPLLGIRTREEKEEGKDEERQLLKRREKYFNIYKTRTENIKYRVREDEGIKAKEVNVEEEKRRWYYPPLKELLPKQVVKIDHKGPLKLLCFSDYRVHSVERLVEFVKGLGQKPDLIVYAGDDIRRFAPPPPEFIHWRSRNEPRLINRVWLKYKALASFETCSTDSYIVRIPKHLAHDSNNAVNELIKVARLQRRLLDVFKKAKAKTSDVLSELEKTVLSDWPSLKIIQEGRCFRLLDAKNNTEILELHMTPGGSIIPDHNVPITDKLAGRITSVFPIREGQIHVYYCVLLDFPAYNVFEELAKHSRYGIVAIAGNDDSRIARLLIRGKKVYEVHSTWLKLGNYLIVGQEGSTCGMGMLGKYVEGDVALRLECALEHLKPHEKLIIISHSPPRGILDRAMRFGEASIGSLALRDFIETNADKVLLVVCGHVHRCGGMFGSIGNTTIINVSSHDDIFSKANIALVTLYPNGRVKTEFTQLPSPLEEALKKEQRDLEEKINSLIDLGLSKSESRLFVETYRRHSDKLFDDLPVLTNLKFRFGFSWDNIFKIYKLGVTSEEQITQEIIDRVLSRSIAAHKVCLKRAWAKVLREREKGRIYLLNSPPRLHNKIMVFDTEYSGTRGVLYGFLDVSSNKFTQFWFFEKDKLRDFLRHKRDYVFIYWGGLDKKLLSEKCEYNAQTVNLLYFVQTSLVAPISTAELKNVYDLLCGQKSDEWLYKHLYWPNGFEKLLLCNRILNNSHDEQAKAELSNMNKADVIALKSILEKLTKLPVIGSSRIH